MTTRGHIQGANRDEAIQCPPRLEEYIAADNPMRLLDAFVDARDRAALGLRHVVAVAPGRPRSQPGDLLQLYIIEYVMRIDGSRDTHAPTTPPEFRIVQQSLTLLLTIVSATVTRSYDTGEQRLVQGPCVELDCALEHGMSGGPIFMVDNLGAVIACAMVTSGTSYAPEGIGSLLYPGL